MYKKINDHSGYFTRKLESIKYNEMETPILKIQCHNKDLFNSRLGTVE